MLIVEVNFKVNYFVSVANQYSMLPYINSSLFLQGYVYDENDKDKPGDTLIVEYKSNYKLGDVVASKVSWPIIGNAHIVKRLVGLPGDKLKIEEHSSVLGSEFWLVVNDKIVYKKPEKELIGYSTKEGEVNKPLYINNRTTYEEYLVFLNSEEAKANGNVFDDGLGGKCIVLKENEYFLLGDNWQDSYDCMDVKKPIRFENLNGAVAAKVDYTDNIKWELFKNSYKLFFS